MANSSFVRCRDLSKIYTVDKQPVKAVDQVNLEIRQGEFITILGHSGSGKTTLLSLIGGLTAPDQGGVSFKGENPWTNGDTEASATRNQSIGFIFQFASLIPTLTTLENIILPMTFGAPTPGGRRKAVQLLEQVGLADKQKSFPGQLSGGQQRRVAIARAFINEPEIILADEPTGDLDETTESEILTFFRQQNTAGTTFVVVTHNSDLHHSQPGARIFQMQQGRLTERT